VQTNAVVITSAIKIWILDSQKLILPGHNVSSGSELVGVIRPFASEKVDNLRVPKS
jgi:hypothetical protein